MRQNWSKNTVGANHTLKNRAQLLPKPGQKLNVLQNPYQKRYGKSSKNSFNQPVNPLKNRPGSYFNQLTGVRESLDNIQ